MSNAKISAPTPTKNLTRQQSLFIRYYLQCFNGAEAVRQAGYNLKAANRQAVQLLSMPVVVFEIQRRMAVLLGKLDISAERVIAEMCKVAFSDLSEVAEWGPDGLKLKDSASLDPSAVASVRTIAEKHTKYGKSLAIQTHDKVKALCPGRMVGPEIPPWKANSLTSHRSPPLCLFAPWQE